MQGNFSKSSLQTFKNPVKMDFQRSMTLFDGVWEASHKGFFCILKRPG